MCVEFCRHCPQNQNTFELSTHQVGLEIILAGISRKYGKCGYMYFTGQGLAHTHAHVRTLKIAHTHTHIHKNLGADMYSAPIIMVMLIWRCEDNGPMH